MLFSGVQRFTLLDFPGKIAAVAFSPGCNMRCGFCHNMEFVLPEYIRRMHGSFIPEESLFCFLRGRVGKLGGVVFSGGEPTQWPDIITVMQNVKKMGFSVKLDTNGSRPNVVAEAISRGVVDAVALDIKTALSQYKGLTGFFNASQVKETLCILQKSNVWYECRTTLIEEIHSDKILEELLVDIGCVRRYALQMFRSENTLLKEFGGYHPLSKKRLDKFMASCKKQIGEVVLR